MEDVLNFVRLILDWYVQHYGDILNGIDREPLLFNMDGPAVPEVVL